MKVKKISTKKPARAKDITGEKFGMWTVESFSHIVLNDEGKTSNYMYNCICECGIFHSDASIDLGDLF